jgi:trans-2,3-dihydro-3-hydroxyanthranilate isomerase
VLVPQRIYSYQVVDVFTETPFEGNQLAVFPDADGLSSAEMQTLARELNLPESAFVLTPRLPEALARVRIFTPVAEMEFAGHPTIGTAYLLTMLGRVPPGASGFGLEENVGLVPIRLERRSDPFVGWLRTPPVSFGEVYDADACAAALGLGPDDLAPGLPAQVVSAGNPFLYVALRDPATVDRAELDVRTFERIAPGFAATGVYVFALAPNGVYARMFAPMSGIREDPATGSATGPLAAYLVANGSIECREGLRFSSEQGTKMQRRSLIQVMLHTTNGALDGIEIGGSAVRVIQAEVALA